MSFNPEKYRQEKMKNPTFRVERILARNAIKLADRICAIREEKGISQEELAQALGTKQSQISRFESTYYNGFSLRSLAKIADALDCSLEVELTPNALAQIPSNTIPLTAANEVDFTQLHAGYKAASRLVVIDGTVNTRMVSTPTYAIEA